MHTTDGARAAHRRRAFAVLLLCILASMGMVGTSSAGPPGTGVSHISVSAAPSVVQRGSRTVVSGQLSFEDFTSPSGHHVVLSVTPPGRSSVDFADITLTYTGNFKAASPKLARVGVFTFTASFAGSASEEAASATTHMTVTVLHLSASTGVVPFKGAVTITAHLDNYPPITSRRVSILADPNHPHGTALFVGGGTVDARGNFTVTVMMRRFTRFRAGWIVHGPDIPSNTIGVHVRPKVTAVLSGEDKRSGSTYEYYATPECNDPGWISCPPFRATLSPAQRGADLCAVEQHLRGTTWQTHYQECIKMGRTGAVTFHVRFGGAFGSLQRVRAYFPGNVIMSPNTTGWTFYKKILLPAP